MKNSHYNELVRLLIANPAGMKPRQIARCIYNSEADLFDADLYGKYFRIHTQVRRFLWLQSRRKWSPFERRKWGIYGLRPNFVYQLELEFDDSDDEGIILTHNKVTQPPIAAEPFIGDLFDGHF